MASLPGKEIEQDVAARPFFLRALQNHPLCIRAWGHKASGEITPQGWLLAALGWDRTSYCTATALGDLTVPGSWG